MFLPQMFPPDFSDYVIRSSNKSPVVLKIFVILFTVLWLTACNGTDTSRVSHGGPVRDHVSFVDTLRTQGLSVEPTGSVAQPFFPVPGQTLTVNGQDVQVFEFVNPSDRETFEQDISSDGKSIGNTMVQWVAPPHFFSKGKIIVLFLGSDQKLLRQLNAALGPQIAGAPAKP